MEISWLDWLIFAAAPIIPTCVVFPSTWLWNRGIGGKKGMEGEGGRERKRERERERERETDMLQISRWEREI